MGDAMCTFNPIYGQGMSVAALQALALRAHLQQHTTPQPVRFFRQIGRIVDVPWSMATGGDLAFPKVVGRRTIQMRLLNGYLAKLLAGAAHDPRLGRAFLRVAGLVDPPQALLAPGVAARVLRRGPAPVMAGTPEAPDNQRVVDSAAEAQHHVVARCTGRRRFAGCLERR